MEPLILSGSIALGCRPDWLGFAAAVDTYRTLLPIFERLGIAGAIRLEVDTMATRLADDMVRNGVPFVYATLIGVWIVV